MLSLDEIIIRGLHFFDMGVSEKEFKEFWSVNSSNKFVVLYLEKPGPQIYMTIADYDNSLHDINRNRLYHHSSALYNGL